MKTFLGVALGGAVLAALSCSGEPPLYPGGPAGPATELKLSQSLFVVQAGASVSVAARTEDDVGNATADAVSFAPCDAKVSVAAGSQVDQWTSSATITGATLGVSCVTASAAGMTDTIRVRVAPGTIVIAGPDSVLSGAGATFDVEFYSLDGTQLTAGADFPIPEVETLNSFRLPLTATDPLTYDAAGQQPGQVVLQTTTNTDFGSVTTNKIVTVVPGAFTGTVSATTGDIQSGFYKVTRGTVPWDGDETVKIGSKYYGENWDGTAAGTAVAAWYPDSILFRVPAAVAAGTYDLFILDQGPTQIGSKVPFTVTGAPTDNRQGYPGANTPGTGLADKPLPLRFPIAFIGGSTSYYTVTPTTAFQFTMLLQFACPGDLDIEIIDGDFAFYVGDQSGRTLACPEATVWRTPAAGFNFIRIYNFEPLPQYAQMIVYPGCVDITNGDGVHTKQTGSSSNWVTSGCPS
jgi:hypothetical protein